MLEVLEYYQSLAQKFQGQLLMGPGILIVLTGLCIWLAGLRWRRVLGAAAGAAIAMAGVLAVGKCSATVLPGACVVGLAAGALANKFVLGLSGAIVGVLVVMIILAGKLATGENANNFVSECSYSMCPEYEQDGVIIPASAALEITTKTATYFVDRTQKAITSAGVVSYAGTGLAAVIVVFAALTVSRLYITVFSSLIGSAIIFTGMIILLFYKGSRPINYIAERPLFYAMVFAAMIIFGTVTQLILSPPAAKQIKTDSPDKENGEKK